MRPQAVVTCYDQAGPLCQCAQPRARAGRNAFPALFSTAALRLA